MTSSALIDIHEKCGNATYPLIPIQFNVKIVKSDFDTNGIVLYKPSYYTIIIQKHRV